MTCLPIPLSSVASEARCDVEPGVLASSSVSDGNSDIYLMDADGTAVRHVTSAISQELEPSWSPDGTRIAYRSRRPHWALYAAALDGTDEVQVTEELSWSPVRASDGRWLRSQTARKSIGSR